MSGLMSSGSVEVVYKIASNLNFKKSITIDVKSKVSSYYRLTNDNFIVCLNGGRSNRYGEIDGKVIWAGYNPIKKSYDKVSGILTLSGYGPSLMYSGGIYYDGNAIVDVYVVQKMKDVS